MVTVTTTAFFAAILGLMQVVFTLRVGVFRRAEGISLGDGGNGEMVKRIRAHANFVETVPMALLLLLLNEISGQSAIWLYSLGTILVVGRLMHYVAIAFSTAIAVRAAGMFATISVILASAILLLV